jgi:hypothetical protein
MLTWFGLTPKPAADIKPTDTVFTLSNLRHQCELIKKYASGALIKVDPSQLVETFRLVAELLVWGDQHDEQFFLYFCEKNVLQTFLQTLSVSPPKAVVNQLLQTLSMIVFNLSSETSSYYIMSNNYLNEIIVHNSYDLHDEEILSNYVNLLRTLSAKLNVDTLQFFFDSRTLDFPLYTQAARFVFHTDSMIRTAARTVSLNVFRVGMLSEELSNSLLDNHALPYMTNHVAYLKNQALSIHKLTSQGALDSETNHLRKCVEDHMDALYYFQDILDLGIHRVSGVLCDQLLSQYVLPVLVGSLRPFDSNNQSLISLRISHKVGFFLLGHFFHVILEPQLINAVLAVLFRKRPILLGKLLVESPPSLPVASTHPCEESKEVSQFITEILYTKQDPIDHQLVLNRKPKELLRPTDLEKDVLKRDVNLVRVRSKLAEVQEVCCLDEYYKDLPFREPVAAEDDFIYRSMLIERLKFDNNDETSFSLCCQLIRIILKNKEVNHNELIPAGLCPQGTVKVQKLINSLVLENPGHPLDVGECWKYCDEVVDLLTATLKAAVIENRWSLFSVKISLSLLFDLLRDPSLLAQDTPLFKDIHLQTLSNTLVELQASIQQDLSPLLIRLDESKTVDPIHVAKMVKALQIIDDVEAIPNFTNFDLDVRDFLSDFGSLVGCVCSGEHSSNMGPEVLHRVNYKVPPVKHSDHMAHRIALYICLAEFLNQTCLKSFPLKLLNLPLEKDYPFFKGMKLASVPSSPDLDECQECDILATEHGGLRKLCVVILSDYFLLFDQATNSIEMCSHLLRTDAAASDRDNCMIRFSIRAESRPYVACRLLSQLGSPDQTKLKIWSVAVRFRTGKSAIVVLEQLFQATCRSLSRVFQVFA